MKMGLFHTLEMDYLTNYLPTMLLYYTDFTQKKLERKEVQINWFDSRNAEMVATSTWKVSSLASASSVRSLRG